MTVEKTNGEQMNWLFLRGLTREKTHWGSFPQVFEETVPQSKIHFLDLPGIGTEMGRAAPTSIEEMTEDLRKRWAHLRDDTLGPWSMLSISLGSMVGLDWVYRYPDDFKQLVIINTSAANLNVPWERLNYRLLPKLATVARLRDPYAKEKMILQMTTHMQRDIDARAQEWGDVSKARPVKVATAMAQIRAALMFKLRTPIRVPVLALNSVNDRFTAKSCSEKVAKALEVPLITHSFAGHDIPLDDPEWVAKNVKDFAQTVS